MRDLTFDELDLVVGGNRTVDSDRDGIPDYDDWEPDYNPHAASRARLFVQAFGFFFGG